MSLRSMLLGVLACGLIGCAGGGETRAGRAAVLSAGGGAAAVEAWTFQGNRGVAFTTPHYRVLTTVDRPIVAGRLPGFAEASLARIREAFPSLPEPRSGLEVFVLGTRPEWRRFVIEAYGEDGLRRYDPIMRGGFTQGARSVLWDMGVQDTFAILAHEGWHQYAQATMREPLPVWLDEGIAAWAEGFRWSAENPNEPVFLPWSNMERFDQLRAAHGAGELLSLQELLTMRPQELIRVSDQLTLTYYAQAWALVHYLRSDPAHAARLEALLADAVAGRVGSTIRARYGQRASQAYALRRTGLDPWRAYLGEDLDAESEAFEAFIGRVVAPGAKNRVVAGESPLS